MRQHRNITVTEKLTGLAVAMLLVGGLSSATGSLLNRSNDRLDYDFVAFDNDFSAFDDFAAPVIRVEAVEGLDKMFFPREFMDERSAEALEQSLEYGLAQAEELLNLHESKLEALETTLEDVLDMPRIPEPLRAEMISEISMQIRQAEREVRRTMAETRRAMAETARAGAESHRAVAEAARARVEAAEAAPAIEQARPKLAPLQKLLPLPPVTPERQACGDRKKSDEEKGSKDGKEGFMEALSFV
ncbi:hypothetical protein [Emcibacter sp.]|uniref:hypothetical protein n=1 Tax=Emcibacter sp. TaxID=1979954 RepID=UPI002AA6F916|nr:hypothetical protein [Emcibacter sp.]